MHSPAHSYSVISIDIVNSSAGGSWRHKRLVNDLRVAVSAALAECPHGSRWVIRKDGDSMTIAVPPAVSKDEVIGEFPPRVDRELRRSNAGLTPDTQLRIRMAVTHGDVVVEDNELIGGPALVEAARIRDIEPLRRAMSGAAHAYIGLVLADHVFQTSVLDGDPALMPHAYRSVVAEAKEYRGRAWIRLLGVELAAVGDTGGADPDTPSQGPRPVARPSADHPDSAYKDTGGPSTGDTYNTRIKTANGPFAIGRGANSQGDPRAR